ncbi:MAG: phospho-sugar mutase [Actinomycetia bacterium]|nr:phospho-sugar mutase [Actinomycetes bacterium]
MSPAEPTPVAPVLDALVSAPPDPAEPGPASTGDAPADGAHVGAPAGLRAAARAWIADEVDPVAADELRALLDDGAWDELADRFAGPLTFGTAGLRGPLRAGPNGMNRVVARRAAAGLAAWLTERGRAGQPVVVGHDARHGSADFARDSAAILTAAGFDAVLLPGALPTPVLAFAARRLRAAAGVMVTASHNPRADNGYKVYDADGGQIAPPADAQIEAAIRALGATRDIRLDERYTVAEQTIVTQYVAAVAGLIGPAPVRRPEAGASAGASAVMSLTSHRPTPGTVPASRSAIAATAREMRIVHTALHGVSTAVIQAVFAAAGLPPLIEVPSQSAPDPDFPTVAFPNPEEPGALDLAIELARARRADLIIANDPDGDRCAVAVPAGADGGDWRLLRGDEVGALLADALMDQGVGGTYATTVVSSQLLRAICAARGAPYAETLTGFKWICRAAPDLGYGYEEALGYAVAPDLVRDKDGISAALLVAERAAQLRAAGSSLMARLEELAIQFGRHATDQVSVRLAGPARVTELMSRLRANPPATLLDEPVAVTDLLPDADLLSWRVDGARVVLRPSGTEPKLKAYLEVITQTGADATAARLSALRAETEALLAC